MPLRGQASSEYLGLFFMMLIVAIVALAVVASFSDFTSGTTLQKSRYYWQAAKPFAVTNTEIIPNKLVLELKNNEAVTLTVRAIKVNGVNLTFSNTTLPATWISDYRCTGGICAMAVRPGQTQVAETTDFTSNPANPCVGASGFSEGGQYEVDLDIVYSSGANGDTSTESGQVNLAGLCSNVNVSNCPTGSSCCGVFTYSPLEPAVLH